MAKSKPNQLTVPKRQPLTKKKNIQNIKDKIAYWESVTPKSPDYKLKKSGLAASKKALKAYEK